MRRWCVVAVALFAAGCSSGEVGTTPAELKARWDAQNVAPQNYKSDILAFMRTYVSDPLHVRNAQVSQPVLKPLGPGDRFIVCVKFRERKPNGSYAPPKDGAATFVSGRLDRFLDTPLEVTPLCKDVPLEPFPELEKMGR